MASTGAHRYLSLAPVTGRVGGGFLGREKMGSNGFFSESMAEFFRYR